MKRNAIAGLFVSTALFFAPQAAGAAEDPVDMSVPPGCAQTGDMGSMMSTEARAKIAAMDEVNRSLMQVVMAMQEQMTQGAMAPDADLAFVCSMIAHHKGAIAMAKIQLKYGKDDGARTMAEKTIAEQSREIDDMTTWLSEHPTK